MGRRWPTKITEISHRGSGSPGIRWATAARRCGPATAFSTTRLCSASTSRTFFPIRHLCKASALITRCLTIRPRATPGFRPPVALRATPLPYHTPYVQNWSLDVQRQFGAGLVVDVGYYGNKGTHLLGIIDINEVPPGLAASLGLPTITRTNTAQLLNPLRPYRGYNAINTISTRFDSNYNSLQVSVQKRFSQGSLVEANYTWSHCLTDNQTDRSTAPQNSYNLAAEYGPCQ